MNETTGFLIHHGLSLVFTAVFVEQMGLPVPALPWLLGAGALSAVGRFNFPLGLFFTVTACLIADTTWFYLGRYRGNQVLGFLCRISLEPDSCVRRTQNVFTRYGMRGILVAKFLPGLSAIAPPLAGMSGIKAGQFLLFDSAGSTLYGFSFLFIGYLFSRQIEQIAVAFSHIGASALSLIVGLAALYVAYKYWQRQHLLRELRTARITADELRQMLDSGKAPLILDLRSNAALEQDPVLIQGALHLSMDEIERRQHEFPRDRDIVVYCSCPNEVSSARVALFLQRKGFTRVRPLQGGIDAWRSNNYPTEIRGTSVTGTASVTTPTPNADPSKTAPRTALRVADPETSDRN